MVDFTILKNPKESSLFFFESTMYAHNLTHIIVSWIIVNFFFLFPQEKSCKYVSQGRYFVIFPNLICALQLI